MQERLVMPRGFCILMKLQLQKEAASTLALHTHGGDVRQPKIYSWQAELGWRKTTLAFGLRAATAINSHPNGSISNWKLQYISESLYCSYVKAQGQ